MGETTDRVGNAVMWSVLARVGRFLLGLISSVIVVRGLGDYQYGVLSLVRMVLAFGVIIAGAGLGQALLKFLPTLRVAGDAAGSRSIVRRIVLFQAGAWLFLMVVIYFAQAAFERVFQIEAIGDVIFVAMALSSVELVFTLVTQILNAHYDTKLLSVANVVAHAIFIVLLLIFAGGGLSVLRVILAGAIGNFIACLILVKRVAALFTVGSELSRDGGVKGVRLLKYSLPFALIGILNMVVWRQSETLFLAHYKGASVTGFFDLAYRIPQSVLEFVPATIWPILMAGFSEVYAKDRSMLLAAIEKYYKVLFMLCAPICFLGIALGGRMIPILFGEAMAPASIPTQLFFAIFTVSFFSTPLSMALYAMEKSYVNMTIYIGLALINIGLDILLIPRYGLPGAMIPVALVILLSPFVYRAALDRFLPGAPIPLPFILRCFAAASPILLLLPFADYIRGGLELAVAAVLAMGMGTLGFKKARVIGGEEVSLLSGIPFPFVGRLLRFMSS